MKKLLLALLVISGLIGSGLSAWYIGTKQTSHSEFVTPEIGKFEVPEDPTLDQNPDENNPENSSESLEY